MCGIAGFIGFNNPELIHQMSKDMLHRGPDGEGFFLGDKVTLLSRRLAIIDRAGGDQPIYNEDKSVVVVYNGEIYNYVALRQELEAAGHTFATHADTEVLVHGYEQYGEQFFDRCNGMFGLALYDMKHERLIVARDHFGIKPIYLAYVKPEGSDDLSLIFASEIKPILNSGLVAKKPNDRIIYRYLRYRIHDDGEETFFEGITRVMPGEMLIIEKGKVARKYFSNLEKAFAETPRQDSLKKADTEEFRRLLIESVKMRLVSEVPVGSCLSGGLDSSTVVAIVNKLLKEKVAEAESVGEIQNTFSAVFPGSTNDEERYVDALTKPGSNPAEPDFEAIRDITIHKVRPTYQGFYEDLADFVRTQEEPTISTGPYAQYKVMQEAHKFVTVVLDGQGADEMMAGYLPYYFVYLNQLKQQKKYAVLAKEVGSSLDVLSKYFMLKARTKLGLKKNVQATGLLNSKFTGQYKGEKFVVNNSNLKARLNEDIFHNSLPSLLRYEDKNSMRFSIEGRVPFLDFNLLRFINSLSDEAIIKMGWNKRILREATRDLLPKMINGRRNKIGFTTPEHEWFLKMKEQIFAVFLSESFANRPYFNRPEVLKAFQLFCDGKFDDTMVFWRMLNLELWLRLYIDPPTENVVAPEIKAKRKAIFAPNEGKKLEIEAEAVPQLEYRPKTSSNVLVKEAEKVGTKRTYLRFPIQTDLFKKGDNVPEKVRQFLDNFLNEAETGWTGENLKDKKFFVVLSEKVVAISQGRSYFVWEIQPGFWAKVLSKYVTKTPAGIGLGSPWTMQIAIQEAGLPRIMFASAAAAITKPLGKRGVFYQLVGPEVASIDGPTEYSLFPANVSAKLGPKNPQQVAEEIKDYLLAAWKDRPELAERFQGAVIIDANDLGRNILGNATPLKDSTVAELFRDNPLGQGSEQTPLALVF